MVPAVHLALGALLYVKYTAEVVPVTEGHHRIAKMISQVVVRAYAVLYIAQGLRMQHYLALWMVLGLGLVGLVDGTTVIQFYIPLRSVDEVKITICWN